MSCRAGRYIAMGVTGSTNNLGTVMRVQIPRDGYTTAISSAITLAEGAGIVNWGDGSLTRHDGSWTDSSSDLPTHSYSLGPYVVTLADTVSGFAIRGDNHLHLPVTELLSLGSNVTQLTPAMFYGCSELATPSGIDWSSVDFSTGVSAFWGCSSITGNLSWVPSFGGRLPDGIFRECTGITSLSGLKFVADTVDGTLDKTTAIDTIGEYAFYGCIGLTTLPSMTNVKEICEGAFWNCDNLTSADIDRGMSYNFMAVSGKPSTRKLGDRAFAFCHSLTHFTVPGLSPWFGDEVFQGCTSLKSMQTLSLDYYIITVTFSDNTTGIEFYTSHEAGGLVLPIESTSVSGTTFTLTDIGGHSYTFTESKTVSSVSAAEYYREHRTTDQYYIPSVMGEGCFYGCTSLTTTRGMPSNLREWPARTFQACTALTEIKDVFANSGIDETSILYNWSNISSGDYSNSDFTFGRATALLSLGERCFSGCTGLTQVNLAGVQSIGEACFQYCSNVQSFIFSPKTHTVRASYAGSTGSDSGYATLTAESTVDQVATNAFSNCSYGVSTEQDATSSTNVAYGETSAQSLLVRFDSRFCPVIAAGAFTNNRYSAATSTINLIRPWLVIQLRTYLQEDGIYANTGTTDPNIGYVDTPVSHWAEDALTKGLMRIQLYQDINQNLSYDAVIKTASDTTSSIAANGVYVSHTLVYAGTSGGSSNGYYLRNLRVSLAMGKSIIPEVNTPFSIPVCYGTSGRTCPEYRRYAAKFVGWDYDNNHTIPPDSPQKNPIFEFTEDIPWQINSNAYDGTYRTSAELWIPQYAEYSSVTTDAATTLVADADHPEEGGNLQGLTFTLAASSELPFYESATDLRIPVTIGSAVQNITAKAVGKVLVFSVLHRTGIWCHVVQITSSVAYAANTTVTVASGATVWGSGDSNIRGESWPQTPREIALENIAHGYYSI